MVLHDEGGAGPPILLLHGLMGSARTWRPHLEWFAAYGHVYTFDALGHGRSGPAVFETETFVADLAAALDRITEPVVAVGHSMGALHAWTFAAHHPGRVRAIIVEDMAPDFRGQTADGWAALVSSWPQPFPSADAVLRHFGPVAGQYFLNAFNQDTDGYRLHGEVPVFERISAEWGQRSFWPEWDQISCPALILEAEYSITPPGQMCEMARRHRDANYLRVPGSGHLIHDEQPGTYRLAVGNFLEQLPGEGEPAVGKLFDKALHQQ